MISFIQKNLYTCLVIYIVNIIEFRLSLPQSDFKSFDTRTRTIASLDKDGNAVERQLTIPAKFIQSVHS